MASLVNCIIHENPTMLLNGNIWINDDGNVQYNLVFSKENESKFGYDLQIYIKSKTEVNIIYIMSYLLDEREYESHEMKGTLPINDDGKVQILIKCHAYTGNDTCNILERVNGVYDSNNCKGVVWTNTFTKEPSNLKMEIVDKGIIDSDVSAQFRVKISFSDGIPKSNKKWIECYYRDENGNEVTFEKRDINNSSGFEYFNTYGGSKLKPGTTHHFRLHIENNAGKAETECNSIVEIPTVKVFMDGRWHNAVAKIYTDGRWKTAVPKVYSDGVWKRTRDRNGE